MSIAAAGASISQSLGCTGDYTSTSSALPSLSSTQSFSSSQTLPQASHYFSGSSSSAIAAAGAAITQTYSTYTVKPDVDPLEREKREIEKRRQRFEDRKARILHPKSRLMGVDTPALAEQVKERQEKDRQEYERESYYDDVRLHQTRTLVELEQAKHRNDKIRQFELHEYHKGQAAEKRIHQLRQEQDAFEGGYVDDPNTPFLKFQGEDLEKDARVEAQKHQQKIWLTQQVYQTQQKELRQKRDEDDYALMQSQIKQMQDENVNEADKNRKQLLLDCQEYNKQVVAQKLAEKRRQSSQNVQQDQNDIHHHMRSGFLNEAVGQSALGPNRTIPYDFKGFTTDKRQAILDEQRRQQEDLRMRREQEWLEEKEYTQQESNTLRELIKQDRAKQEAEKLRRYNLSQEHIAQKKQHNLRTQYLNDVVYTNPVKEEFFNQFGQSCR